MQNCIGFKPKEKNYHILPENFIDPMNANGNSWDNNRAERFVSLSPSLFMAPRKTDGSLPDNGFGKVK